MPGYGFAEAPKVKVLAWNKVLRKYLAGRRTLLRVYVMIDARHGLKNTDTDILDLLDTGAVSYQAVLTKSDTISRPALEAVTASVLAGLAKRPAAFPEVIATSSKHMGGVDVLRANIARLLKQHGG
jgi:GTP-binding protein